MKQTMGYISALFLGLFVGWLAQQFWFFSREPESVLPSERNLERFHNRLSVLKHASSSLPDTPLTMLTEKSATPPVKQLLEEKDFEAGIEWYQNTLSTDLSLALDIAELGYDKAYYEQLLFFLYDLRLQLDVKDEQRLLKKIYAMVERIEKQLMAEQRIDRLVDIFRLLISLEAENTLYYLRLSYWLIQVGDLFQAKEALIGAKNDIRYQGALRELQDFIAQTENGQLNFVIPLIRAGEHYLVTVLLNEDVEVQLMLDTGATKTVLKSVLADQLSESATRGDLISMNTANGQAKGRLVTLRSLQMGGLNLTDIEMVVMDLPSFKYDGLLGMNILNKYEFSIDQAANQLILRPRLKTL